MLYHLLKVLVFIASKVYFQRLWFYNRERIPENRRTIFTGNHPSAFLDAVLPASHLPGAFYFLVRGDIFGNRYVRRLLFTMHTLPIFRFRDGFERMRGNQDTFDRSYALLARGRNPISLMAEGGNSERKRLLPLQKGAARLAFGAFDAHGVEDICLVPYGVNYSNIPRFRSVAMISYGEPLYLKDYLDAYLEDPRKAISLLTQDLEKRMRREVVQIDRGEDEVWANPLLDIAREGEGKAGAHERELARAQRINTMTPQEKEACQSALDQYKKLLSEAGLRRFDPQGKADLASGLWYLTGFLPFGLAWLLNAPPLLFTHWLIKKLVPSPIFFPSIRFTAGIFIWLGYWLCLAVALAEAVVVGLCLAVALAEAVVVGFWSLPFFEGFGEWRDAWRVQRMREEKRAQLQFAREELLQYIK